MAVKELACVLVLFTLCAYTYGEGSKTNDHPYASIGDVSQAVNCTVSEDVQLGSAFLTCLFPFDVRSQNTSFNVQAYNKTGKKVAPDLLVGCLWRRSLQCVGKEDYVLQQEHEVKTNATFKIPIEEAKSLEYSCNLAPQIHTSNPCFLNMQDNDNNLVVIISCILSGISIVIAIIVGFMVKKKLFRLHFKGLRESRMLASSTATDPQSLQTDEQQDVKQWIKEQSNFLFECKNLPDDASESVMDQFMEKITEIVCEINIWREVIKKDTQDESALQLLSEMSVKADYALILLENMQEAIIHRNIISKIRATNQIYPQSNMAVESFLSEANSLADMLWAEGNKDHTPEVNLKLMKSVKNVLCECLHREKSLKLRLQIDKSESALELETKLHALEEIRSTFLDLKVIFFDNLHLSAERAILKRNRELRCTKMNEVTLRTSNFQTWRQLTSLAGLASAK